jgi:hypothetical protein
MYEDDEWLVLRPLTRESSVKYGAGTKWCTASTNEEYQFYRYTRRGILIYTINKKTGQKVAAFKNTDPYNEPELSFWNEIDTRIDSYEAELPEFIMKLIFTEFKTTSSNYDITPEQWQIKEELSKSISLEEPMDMIVEEPTVTTYTATLEATLQQAVLDYNSFTNPAQNEQH